MTLIYEEFMAFLRQEGEQRATQGGLIPIPELRSPTRLSSATYSMGTSCVSTPSGWSTS